MGHKIAVLPKADLSQLDVTAAFHEKAPSISVFPLNSPHSFVTKNVYHTADRERRTSTVDSLIAPYTTDEVPGGSGLMPPSGIWPVWPAATSQ